MCNIFNKHDYEIIKDYKIESPFEIAMKAGMGFETVRCTADMIRTKIIIVFKCKKCDKIRIEEYSNL